MARKPKGRTRSVVKRWNRSAKDNKIGKLMTGIDVSERKERAEKMNDVEFMKQMKTLDKKAKELRKIKLEQKEKKIAALGPALVKRYVNAHDWTCAMKFADIPSKNYVKFLQVLRKKEIKSTDAFLNLPTSEFEKFEITPEQKITVVDYINELMEKYAPSQTV
eukprot:TRINITY_DN5393_c0_g1_i1.p1 TRINITY_DN5393_c0_g1~~TRINITY_DN5393_c0_g1_i1.p1  ORF type:complete len:163 (-),score=35.00 TRINITY_DN5393_c0_g1_i1:29-517(-)